MNALNFDYFYGTEADQFSFIRIPRILIDAPHFKNLSWEAMGLYGMMLDRMGLSMKNQWLDEYNRVFIYFTLEDIMECMKCGHNKGVKLLADLDVETGIGLIERVRQGQGKPTRIYVKNFNLQPNPGVINKGTPDFPKPEVQTSEKRTLIILIRFRLTITILRINQSIRLVPYPHTNTPNQPLRTKDKKRLMRLMRLIHTVKSSWRTSVMKTFVSSINTARILLAKYWN